jgi:hypothetical protein
MDQRRWHMHEDRHLHSEQADPDGGQDQANRREGRLLVEEPLEPP